MAPSTWCTLLLTLAPSAPQYDLSEDWESLTFVLEGLIMGGDDFAASIGATRTKSNTELLLARQV